MYLTRISFSELFGRGDSMTDRNMQISFLPQDIEFVKEFLQGKSYLDIVSYDEDLDCISIDMTKVKGYDRLCSGITDLIINIIKRKEFERLHMEDLY